MMNSKNLSMPIVFRTDFNSFNSKKSKGSNCISVPSAITVDDLIVFCRNHRLVYLYGAGARSRELAFELNIRGGDYEAHLVSDLQNNESEVNGKPVKLVEQVNLVSDEVGVIIAVGEKYQKEIVEKLVTLGCEDYIAYRPLERVKSILIEKGINERCNQVKKFADQGYRVGVILTEDFCSTNTNYRYRGYNICQNVKRYSHRWRFVCFSLNEIRSVLGVLPFVCSMTLLRLFWTFEIENLIIEARKQSVIVLYSMDDMLFTPRHAARTLENTRAEGVVYATAYNVFSEAGRIHLLMEKSDGLLLTTTYLKKIAIKEFAKPCQVLGNFLNEEQLAILPSVKKRPGFWLGYFPGTATHGLDFSCCVGAIIRLMECYNDICLRIVGPLVLPSGLERFRIAGRIEEIPLVDFLNLQRLISEVDINLAPLVIDDFTNCKSELKFFEAAIMKTVTCASPTQAFMECITDGINGFLCRNEEDWCQKISYLYLDKSSLEKMEDNAYNYALINYTGSNITKQIECAYDSLVP